MTEQETFGLLGKVFAWLLSIVVANLTLVKVWGQKWIENQFSKDLERFKAETLHDFALLLARKTKWHEKEQEVLSETWKKLIQAHTALRQTIMAFKEMPDLNRMDEEEVNKFLERSDLSEDGKDYVKQHKEDYVMAYSRVLDHRSLNKAHETFLTFHTYFDECRIFLRPHIKEKFQNADDYIWSAWVSQRMSLKDYGKYAILKFSRWQNCKPKACGQALR